MTNKERALRLLKFEDVDRVPAVHFGYWKELLFEWAEQGHISKELAQGWHDGNDRDLELDRILGWDYDWVHTYGAKMGLFPSFEVEVLQTLPDGAQRVRNALGVIERKYPGVVSIPAEDDYTLKDRDAFEKYYLPKMQFDASRVNTEFFEHFSERVTADVPVGINLGSVMGDIRSMASLVGLSYLMYDEDETLLADIVDAYADMQYKCVETVLKTGVKFDYGHFWEDICYNGGSLISPEMFEKLCARHYKKRCDLCHEYGIDLISLDCDGVTSQLLGTWYENGVNVMFPIEIGTWGDQFEPARKKYGQGIRGVGGMDKTALRKDRAAVDREIERIKRLVSLGGYVPCPDHRLMPGSKFELVQYYADEIKKIKP